MTRRASAREAERAAIVERAADRWRRTLTDPGLAAAEDSPRVWPDPYVESARRAKEAEDDLEDLTVQYAALSASALRLLVVLPRGLGDDVTGAAKNLARHLGYAGG